MDINRPNIMLDIETWGSRPGSGILSIAAVQFFPWHEGYQLGDEIEISVAPTDGNYAGLKIDPRTVQWWMQQTDPARREAFYPANPRKLPEALLYLSKWLRAVSLSPLVWGHGASFDPVLLTAAYEACGISVPWEFRDIRDTRTLFDLVADFDPKVFRGASETAHIPLFDARTQARAVCDAMGILGLRKPLGAPFGARHVQMTT